MTKIKQIEHFQIRVHTFCLLMPSGDFHHQITSKCEKHFIMWTTTLTSERFELLAILELWYFDSYSERKVKFHPIFSDWLRFWQLLQLMSQNFERSYLDIFWEDVDMGPFEHFGETLSLWDGRSNRTFPKLFVSKVASRHLDGWA